GGHLGRRGRRLHPRPAPRHPRRGRRPARWAGLRRQGLVRRFRPPDHLRQPGLGAHPSAGRGHGALRFRAAPSRGAFARQDQDGGTGLRPHRRERLARHAAESGGAGAFSRRVLLRFGGGGRGRAGGFRARLRHRRLRARPGELLRPPRRPAELG
ncbi:MAG: Aspartyl-tRNA(Asn) amidotransferase subunit A @ Glutamyl-tRNA(Gln) amidotransferase subunit A, partial [uncultured Acetobacteraceae bacterium]